MDDRDKLMGQIRAMLEKTVERGCTEAEAAAAAAKVEQLVRRHAIDLASMPDAERSEVTSLLEPIRCPGGIDRRWLQFIAGSAARLCMCKAMNLTGRDGGIIFVGYPDEVAAAAAVYRFLSEQALVRCRWEWRMSRRRLGYQKFATAFVMGYAESVADRLERAVSERTADTSCTALVACRDRDIESFVADNYAVRETRLGNLKVDAAAYEAGLAHGSSVSLHPTAPLEGRC